MATNPRAPPPRVLRGVRNGQQARLSWIRTDRGWGVRGGLVVGERIRLLEIGAEDYIVKPFNPMELKIRVKKILPN